MYGALLEVFQVDDKLMRAVEVTAGASLFHIVCDNEDTALRITEELRKQQAGRATFMPLNRYAEGYDGSGGIHWVGVGCWASVHATPYVCVVGHGGMLCNVHVRFIKCTLSLLKHACWMHAHLVAKIYSMPTTTHTAPYPPPQPLHRLRPPQITYPTDTDRAFPLLRKLKYRPEVAPAVQQVFARTLLCPDLDTATEFARSTQLNCITLDGDEANRKGTLTGGYTGNMTLKLQAWKEFSVRVGGVWGWGVGGLRGHGG